MFDGRVEVDESYFSGVGKGRRGRGGAGKSVVFGQFKRDGKVHTTMPANTTSKTLVGLIRAPVQPDRIVYTDSYRSYDRLDASVSAHPIAARPLGVLSPV